MVDPSLIIDEWMKEVTNRYSLLESSFIDLRREYAVLLAQFEHMKLKVDELEYIMTHGVSHGENDAV